MNCRLLRSVFRFKWIQIVIVIPLIRGEFGEHKRPYRLSLILEHLNQVVPFDVAFVQSHTYHKHLAVAQNDFHSQSLTVTGFGSILPRFCNEEWNGIYSAAIIRIEIGR